jgi:hypothetical protein
MTSANVLPRIAGPTVAPPLSIVEGGKDATGLWARLRPLAYLAPLAVNWPGGWAAL